MAHSDNVERREKPQKFSDVVKDFLDAEMGQGITGRGDLKYVRDDAARLRKHFRMGEGEKVTNGHFLRELLEDMTLPEQMRTHHEEDEFTLQDRMAKIEYAQEWLEALVKARSFEQLEYAEKARIAKILAGGDEVLGDLMAMNTELSEAFREDVREIQDGGEEGWRKSLKAAVGHADMESELGGVGGIARGMEVMTKVMDQMRTQYAQVKRGANSLPDM